MAIAFEKIDDNYSYGTYDDFKVIIMNSNGYINVTKLCKQYGKYFKHWLQNDSSKDLIAEVDKVLALTRIRVSSDSSNTVPSDGIPSDGNDKATITMVEIQNTTSLINVDSSNIVPSAGIPADGTVKAIISIVGTNTTTIRGTYVHKLLVPHIASWLNPAFAIKMSKIVDEYLLREHRLKIANLTNDNSSLSYQVQQLVHGNKEQSRKIDEQSKKIDEQSKQIAELLSHTKDVKHDLACMVDLALEQVEENELHKIKLEKAVPDRINNPIDLNSVEHLVLFNIGQDKYYVIRGTSAYIKTKFKRLTNVTYSKRDSTTSSTEYVYVKTYNDVPNSRHLYRVLKEHYNIAHGNMNSFTSKVDVDKLIDIIQEVFDKRLTVDIGSREKTKVKTIAKSKVSKTLTN